jgi:hypothetical protein
MNTHLSSDLLGLEMLGREARLQRVVDACSLQRVVEGCRGL